MLSRIISIQVFGKIFPGSART